MFYCNPCAQAAKYPETMFRSFGKCELCGEVAVCNDRPSYSLPNPNPELQRRLESLTYVGKHRAVD